MLVQTVPNELDKFFIQLNKICFFCGVPNLSMYDMKYSKRFMKCFEIYRLVSNIVIFAFSISQIAAVIFVQHNLSEKQKVTWYRLIIPESILFAYIIALEVFKDRIKTLLYELVVVLKSTFNDVEVQRDVIKKTKLLSTVFLMSVLGLLLSNTFETATFYKTGEGTPVMTCWPKLHDRSVMANVVRVINVIILWIFIKRVTAIIIIVSFETICLSHQYKNLRRFFVCMNKTFDNDMDAEEEQLKFEQYLKLGIKMHSRTLWCLKQYQDTISIFCSGQILINVPVLVLLMLQMVTLERTLSNVASVAAAGLTLLLGTGFFMCNAGDITVEAAELPTAMYCSGWHRCRGTGAETSRVRRMLTIAIAQAQKPVTIRAFGVIEMSYNSFLKIIKASYSVLTVLY